MTLKNYLKKAQRERWAIGQFNFSTLEQLRAVAKASLELKTPVILGTSEGEAEYFGLEEASAIVGELRKKYKAEIFLNLDHGKSEKIVRQAILAGYSAVHFDGSNLPIEENIKISRRLADFAHKKGVVFEGELGHIGGESAPHIGSSGIKESELTPVELVENFVKKTKVDSLAIAIGTSHGIYTDEPLLDLDRLGKIKQRTKAFLVLHGGSGVSESQIKKAINLGITKINVNTELRIAWKEAWEEILVKEKSEFKPYKILPQIEEIVEKKVVSKILLFKNK